MMVVVLIIAILGAVAIPKFADLVKKSREGATLGHLGSLRSALFVYYGDNEGTFPSGPAGYNTTFLEGAMVPKYLPRWPEAYTPGYHGRTGAVDTINGGDPALSVPDDSGGWVYVSSAGATDWGRINVECYQATIRGDIWSTY